MQLCAVFPNLRMEVADIFAVPNGDSGYKVWMRYYFSCTNKEPSIYGPPSGLAMEKEKAINMSSFHVENVDGEGLIISEKTAHCCDYIRAVCTGDSIFSHLDLL